MKETFTLSASGGLNCPYKIFLAYMLGNAHGRNNLLSSLALRIREISSLFVPVQSGGMEITMENNYIIRTKDGRILHFYKENGNVFLRTKKDGRWSKPDVITENIADDFCVISDGADNLHMIIQNTSGDIVYHSFHHNLWHSYTVFKSKDPATYPKNFRLMLIGDRLLLFYTLKAKEKLILCYSFLGPELSGEKIDTLTECKRPFFCVTDDYHNTYIYYTNANSILGYRVLSHGKTEPGRFMEIEKGCICPYVNINDNTHHIAAKKDNTLCFFTSDMKKASVKKQTVTLQTADCSLPVILAGEKKLWLMYSYKGGVYYGFNDKDTHHWGNFLRFISSGAEPVIFNFQADKVSCQLWGYIINNEIQLFSMADSKNMFTEQKTVTAKPDTPSRAPTDKIMAMLDSHEKQLELFKKKIDRLYIRIEELEKEIKSSRN